MLLLLFVACGPTSEKDSGGTVDDASFGEVTARLSTGTSTVVIVNWTGAVEGAWVEFGADDTYGEEAPARTDGEAILLGNHATSEVHFRLGAQVDGASVYSSDQVITTGAIPSGIPSVATERTDDDAWLLRTGELEDTTHGGA